MRRRFREAMNDDFNTSDAIAVLFDLANEVNKTGSHGRFCINESAGRSIGITAAGSTAIFSDAGVARMIRSLRQERIEQMIQQRLIARMSRNYNEADRIRKELLEASIILEDGPQGTTWRRE